MTITNTSIASTTTSRLFLSSGQNAITTMIFCNITTGTAATMNLYIVPNGSNASPNTQVLNAISIPATETFMFDTEKIILENGDAIYAQASSSTTITATLSSIVTS